MQLPSLMHMQKFTLPVRTHSISSEVHKHQSEFPYVPFVTWGGLSLVSCSPLGCHVMNRMFIPMQLQETL